MMASPFTLIFLTAAICAAVEDGGQPWVFLLVAVLIEVGMALFRGFARDGLG